MEIIYQVLLKSHMVAGMLALLVFWMPALAKKGSRLHRKAGKWFVIAMGIVAITGLPLTLRFFAMGKWIAGTFLGYLLVITVSAIAAAWFALKLKQDRQRFYGKVHAFASWLNLVVGCTVLYMGIAFDVTLLALFSFIGIFGGIDGLRKARKKDELPANWWLEEHLGGMIGGGIAAHVAFGAFGLRQVWPEYGAFDGFIGMLPWILPVVIGVAASAYSSRKYAPKQRHPAA